MTTIEDARIEGYDPEFNVGDTVTVDRYNHIDDVETGVIVGYSTMPISPRLTYVISVGGIKIESTGGSIVESKLYDPVPDEIDLLEK